MPSAVAITHVPFEDFGSLAAVLGVYETDRYPFLSGELELIRRRVRSRRSTLGICLGAQFVAAARRFWRCWLDAAG
jgi:GMP synthase-like glutamine amidotransferase